MNPDRQNIKLWDLFLEEKWSKNRKKDISVNGKKWTMQTFALIWFYCASINDRIRDCEMDFYHTGRRAGHSGRKQMFTWITDRTWNATWRLFGRWDRTYFTFWRTRCSINWAHTVSSLLCLVGGREWNFFFTHLRQSCWLRNWTSWEKIKTKQAGSVLGTAVEPLELIVERWMLHKLLITMDNTGQSRSSPSDSLSNKGWCWRLFLPNSIVLTMSLCASGHDSTFSWDSVHWEMSFHSFSEFDGLIQNVYIFWIHFLSMTASSIAYMQIMIQPPPCFTHGKSLSSLNSVFIYSKLIHLQNILLAAFWPLQTVHI